MSTPHGWTHKKYSDTSPSGSGVALQYCLATGAMAVAEPLDLPVPIKPLHYHQEDLNTYAIPMPWMPNTTSDGHRVQAGGVERLPVGVGSGARNAEFGH